MNILGFKFKNPFKSNQVDKGLVTTTQSAGDNEDGASTFSTLDRSFNFSTFGRNDFINDGYLSNQDVYSIVRKISKVMSAVPLKLLNEQGDEIIEGEVWKDVFERVNKKQNLRKAWEEACMFYLLTGDAYFWQKVTAIGFVPEKLVMPSQLVWPYRANIYGVFDDPEFYEFNDGITIKTIPATQVIRITEASPALFDMQSGYGLSPLQPAKLVLDAANNLNTAEKSIFSNGGANKVVSPKSMEGMMTPDDKDKLTKGLKQRRSGADKFNTALVSDTPIDVSELGLTPEELQLFDMHLTQLRRFCNVYGVDSSIFNDPENKTFNNRKEAEKALYVDVILPLANEFIDVWNKKVLPLIEQGIYLEVDKGEIEALNPDPTERTKNLLEQVKSGVISVDEMREDIGKPKLGGEFAKPITQGNKITIESTSNQEDNTNNDSNINANQQAQASLRGSVGGVQGILAIQASVAQGNTLYNAALATLINIYGFDEATSRELLGDEKEIEDNRNAQTQENNTQNSQQ